MYLNAYCNFMVFCHLEIINRNRHSHAKSIFSHSTTSQTLTKVDVNSFEIPFHSQIKNTIQQHHQSFIPRHNSFRIQKIKQNDLPLPNISTPLANTQPDIDRLFNQTWPITSPHRHTFVVQPASKRIRSIITLWKK